MGQLFTLPRQRAFTTAVRVMPAAKLFFYESGTTTPKSIYADADLNTPHTNPVIADAFGLFDAIWLDVSDGTYTVALKTSANVQQWAEDDIGGSDLTEQRILELTNGVTDEEAAIGLELDDLDIRYPELHGSRYGVSAANLDNYAAITTLISVMKQHGGAEGILPAGFLNYATGLVFDADCLRLVGQGGDRGVTGPLGTVLNYQGVGGTGFKINGVDGCRLDRMLLKNGGSGAIGIHLFNCQNTRGQDFHVREFVTENWLVECDNTKSTIYNNFDNISGFTNASVPVTRTAIGLRMVEGAGKAVNQNIFTNANFGSNLVGIQQDSECHDNVFSGLELGSCATGAKVRGRIALIAANIENCTVVGIETIAGSAYSISGSVHFASNTLDVLNPDGKGFACSFQGGGSSNTWGFNQTQTGLGFRGQVPPLVGINFSITGGDPMIQRNAVDEIEFNSAGPRIAKSLEIDGALNHDGTTVGFYGTAPVVKQTGVAVTDAGIHAALVALGLISA